MSIYELVENCRICKNSSLENVLDLGLQPPANSLTNTANEDISEAPLELMFCKKCNTVQLSVTVFPGFLFNNYLWVTGTSKGALDYSKFFADQVLSRTDINNPFVIEIASNDGTFLNRFKSRGCKILGVDPASNIAKEAEKKGVPTINKFFNYDEALDIKSKFSQADIVIARNVIPHVKELDSIVKGIAELVSSSGLAVIEFHHSKIILDELHYDSIYHEHLFYFSVETLSYVFEPYGLKPFDCFQSPISGGSLVLFLSKENIEISNDLKRIISEEKNSSTNQLDTWQKFALQSKNHAKELSSYIKNIAKSNKIIAYGASARSSTLLNYCDLSTKEIECIIDNNPIKQGLFTPGTHIPIISYKQAMPKIKNNTILLLAWNFKEEIINQLRLDGFKGNIIIPLPNKVHVDEV